MLAFAHPAEAAVSEHGASPHLADVELAEAVARGDRAAAERLARRVLPLVRRVARALLSDRAESEDATQVALLEVLRAAGSYRGAGALESWTRRIASRVVIRHIRRHRDHDPEPAAPEVASDIADDASSTATFDELPRPLESYLAELPEVQRTALVLRHALGHTVPEIAELTEAPIPTVKSRLKKAHQELRRLIRRDVNIGARTIASTS
jgi:RNA polymerase sigma-70 factor (ECF subfamily)